jgi:ADP-heptose:LPS heptosyltransferase
LLRFYEVDVILTGSRAERRYVDGVEQGLAGSRVHNLCGMLSLKDLARLLREAACLISNDSGPVHMASALGTPVVGFYGPETPLRYGPLSSRSLVFYEDLWCSPCMSVDNAKTVHCVNDLACMKQIEPAYVVDRVRQFIESHQLLDLRQKGLGYVRRAVDGSYG